MCEFNNNFTQSQKSSQHDKDKRSLGLKDQRLEAMRVLHKKWAGREFTVHKIDEVPMSKELCIVHKNRKRLS